MYLANKKPKKLRGVCRMYLANKKPKKLWETMIVSHNYIESVAMVDRNCCFIKEEYFLAHLDFQKMLDVGDSAKQSRRTYIFVHLEIDNNHFYLPLRNNLGNAVRPYGRIGHSVPSNKRPNAGIDYRHALVINDECYIEMHSEQKLPNSQYSRITNDYSIIRTEFCEYLRGYKRAARKRRVPREPLFRESSLCNFDDELGITRDY